MIIEFLNLRWHEGILILEQRQISFLNGHFMPCSSIFYEICTGFLNFILSSKHHGRIFVWCNIHICQDCLTRYPSPAMINTQRQRRCDVIMTLSLRRVSTGMSITVKAHLVWMLWLYGSLTDQVTRTVSSSTSGPKGGGVTTVVHSHAFTTNM